MRIKNWDEFQHYDPTKRAAPPWIKLYKKLLDDQEWFDLDGEASKFLVMLWLLASENGGSLPKSSAKIAFRLRLKEVSVIAMLSRLLHWIECPASALLASCYQDARIDIRVDIEESKKKSMFDSFESFWKSYPRKVGKGAALKSWQRHVKNGDAEKIMRALEWQVRSEQWTKDGSQFVPMPATYLNQQRWLDEPVHKAEQSNAITEFLKEAEAM